MAAKKERCGRCGEVATQVVIRRNAAGRPAGGLRACQRHADEAIASGFEFSFNIAQSVDIADRGWKS